MAMKVPDDCLYSRRTNPFAATHSTYASFDGARLVRPRGGKSSDLEEFVHDSFRGLALNPKFSCVVAQSALKTLNYRIGLYDEMPTTGDSDSAEAVAHDLFDFVVEQPSFDGLSTFVATFRQPMIVNEDAFEHRLWQTLQSLQDIDVVHPARDRNMSSDPKSAHFLFSFGGLAFDVVGLHAAASRFTHRFAFPTLVFNAP